MSAQVNLQIRDVSKVFRTDDDRVVEALSPVSFELHEGELVCLVGPTGCGKTTLLRMVAGLEKPSTGAILVDGKSVDGPGADRGMVFQQYSLFPWRTALSNVAFGLEMQGVSKKERIKRSKKALEEVGLSEFAGAFPYELSGGMQQRVAIARALVNEPHLLLMDEPFGSLDERTRQLLQDVLIDLRSSGKKLMLLVTHNLDEAVYLADRVLILGGMPGRVIGDVRIKSQYPRNRLSQEFVDYLLQIRQIIARDYAGEDLLCQEQ